MLWLPYIRAIAFYFRCLFDMRRGLIRICIKVSHILMMWIKHKTKIFVRPNINTAKQNTCHVHIMSSSTPALSLRKYCLLCNYSYYYFSMHKEKCILCCRCMLPFAQWKENSSHIILLTSNYQVNFLPFWVTQAVCCLVSSYYNEGHLCSQYHKNLANTTITI